MGLPDRFVARSNEVRLSREELLGARVVRNPEASEEKKEDGSIVLSYPVELTGFMKLLHRFSSKRNEKLARRVELDKAGTEVWRLADGAHTVGDIAVQVAVSYQVPDEEAEKSTAVYVRMLAERGLVQLVIGEPSDGATGEK